MMTESTPHSTAAGRSRDIARTAEQQLIASAIEE
jgi:hypothetical protein